MPYIKNERRKILQAYITLAEKPQDVGELNYVITQLCRGFLSRSKASYEDHNAIVGVLESAKLEFYRRAVAAYEDEKIQLNGDVYE